MSATEQDVRAFLARRERPDDERPEGQRPTETDVRAYLDASADSEADPGLLARAIGAVRGFVSDTQEQAAPLVEQLERAQRFRLRAGRAPSQAGGQYVDMLTGPREDGESSVSERAPTVPRSAPEGPDSTVVAPVGEPNERFFGRVASVVNSPFARDTLFRLAGIRPDTAYVLENNLRITRPDGSVRYEAGSTPADTSRNVIKLRQAAEVSARDPRSGIEQMLTHELAHLGDVQGFLAPLARGLRENVEGFPAKERSAEAFADAFEEAVGILRQAEGPEDAVRAARELEGDVPGVTYLTEWLSARPLFTEGGDIPAPRPTARSSTAVRPAAGARISSDTAAAERENERERVAQERIDRIQANMTAGERILEAGNAFAQAVGGIGADVVASLPVLAETVDEILGRSIIGQGARASVQFGLEAAEDITSQELAAPFNLTDEQTAQIVEASEAIREFAQEAFPTDPRLQEAFLESVLPRGLGSFAGFAGATALGTAVGGPAGGFAVGGSLGASSAAGRGYTDALRHGADPETAIRSGQLAGLLGTTEVLPVFRALDRIGVSAAARRKIVRGLQQGLIGTVEEGLQEAGAQVGYNAIAKALYDDDRELSEGLVQSGQVGGAVGFLANTLLSLLPGRQSGVRFRDAVQEGAERVGRAARALTGRERDELTGAASRRPDERRTEQALRRRGETTRVARFRVDIDNFKRLNDALGHEAGDRALQVAADALGAQVRSEDTVRRVPSRSRVGGDEFAVTLQVSEDADVNELRDAMEIAVDDALAEAELAEAGRFRVGASIGVSEAPIGEEVSAEELDRAADEEAMRRKEELGRSVERDVPASAEEVDTGYVGPLPVDLLKLDADRFQYKLDTDERGETGALKDVKAWEPESAGLVLARKDPDDGNIYVVEGHQRKGLADRLGIEIMPAVMVIEAETDSEARAKGALANMRMGTGTSMDAATFMRDQNMTVEDLRTKNVPLTNAVTREAVKLAELADPLFRQVAAGKIPERRAAVIGGSGLDDTQQMALWEMVQRREARGNRLTNDAIEELARFVRAAPETQTTQETLFGTETETRSLVAEKAEISAYIKRRLGQERRAFETVSKERTAREIEAEEGNVLATEANRGRARETERLAEVYERLSTRSGPVANVLNEAARQLADKGGANANDIKEEAFDRVRTALSEGLEGGTGPRLQGLEGSVPAPQADPEARPQAGPRGVSRLRGPQRDPGPRDEGLTLQGGLFGGSEATGGSEQRELGGLEGPGGLPGAERDAREIVRRLRTKVEAGFATDQERERYRDALAMLRRGEGLSEEEVRLRSERAEAEAEPDDTAELLPSEASEGDPDKAPHVAPGGFINLRALSKGTAHFFRKNFTSAGDLPAVAFREKVRRDAWIEAQSREVAHTLRDFGRAAREVYGRARKMPESDLHAFNEVIHGERDVGTLPESLRPVAKRMRQQVDALSQKMISEGVVQGDLAATVADNMGVWLTRSYRVFDDPRWADKVPEDVNNKVVALIRKEYPERSEAEVQGILNALLNRGEGSPIALIASGKLGHKDLSILKRRKEIAPEIRALWGEFLDPRVNYVRSMTKMTHLIANHKFLSEVRQRATGEVIMGEGIQPEGGFLFDRPVVVDGVSYHSEIAAEGSGTMAPLAGLYTTPEIKQAFEDVLERPRLGPWMRRYMKVNSAVKFSKTVLSVMTHVRNTTGNVGFAVANGHWRVGHAGGALRTVLADLGALDQKAWEAKYRRYAELGVTADNARAGELRDVIRDATKSEFEDPGMTLAGRSARKTASALSSAYRAEDDVWKIYAFENEMSRLRKALPDTPLAELEQRAAEIVRNTYPTYSMVPRGVKALRRSPAVGSFTSFAAEVYRVGYNTIRQTQRELADPDLRGIGAQRLAGLLAAGSGPAAAGTAAAFIVGMTAEDDEDMRRFLPFWSENSELLYLGRDEQGRIRYIDLSYTDPYSYLKTPLIAFIRGADWEQALLRAGVEALRPFLDEEILAEKVLDLTRNTTRTGGRVYNPQAPFHEKAQDVLAHLWDALEPGTVRSMERIAQGIQGEQELYGRAYDPVLESVATATGVRISVLDPRQGLSWNAYGFNREWRDARQQLSAVTNRRGRVTAEEMREAYVQMERSRREVFEDLHKDVQAAIGLGVKPGEAYALLDAAGLSKERAYRVVVGDYAPYNPSTRFLARTAESAASTVDPNDRPEVLAEFADRRRLIEHLAREAAAAGERFTATSSE